MKMFLKKLFFPQEWRRDTGVSRRVYNTYEDYVNHQRAKLNTVGNPERKRIRLRNTLRERLTKIPEVTRGASVLCLAARFGGECEAFIDCGAFAIMGWLVPAVMPAY